jgi:DMSO reductase family type II enzyme heme b subunit
MRTHCWLLAVGYLLLATSAWGQEEVSLTPEQETGKKVYDKWCSHCHGASGQGDGPAADYLRPRPRDFTYGLYKIRSTESGQLPTDEDLFKMISEGMPGTGMPDWKEVLTEQERQQVVQYIKTFSRKFARAKEPPKPIKLGKPASASSESIERGKALFRELECFKCHGDEGRADGPSAPELTDDWGFPIRPANLTRKWDFRGGHRPEDIYMRLLGGVAGTPMPSFVDSLDEQKAWDLANYVLSLSPEQQPPLRLVLKAHRMEGDVPEDPEDGAWAEAELSEYPMVGQIILDPRQFTPTVNAVRAQALFNDHELALRLTWDDPTQSLPNEASEIFEDAVAVQFPAQIPIGAKRPYFLMGDPENPVNLWRWGSGQAGGMEYNARGSDQQQQQPVGSQQVKGAIRYRHGQYQLVFKRPLATQDRDQDIQFAPGQFIPMAFYVWDGENHETGIKMALSHWYYLLLPPPIPTKVYVFPVVAIVIFAGFEWWVIRRMKKK